MVRGGHIYIMTNKTQSTLYIGVTSDLRSRVYQHKTRHYPLSFTARFNLVHIVYYEFFDSIEEAIQREKQLKKWRRSKKNKLIEMKNPHWNDLWRETEDL